jgi:hypothetical protein
LLIRPCLADHSAEKVLKVLARKTDINRIMPRRMETLTKEEALLSVSKSAATPTGEKPTRDAGDDLDAIQEVNYKADDSAIVPQVGAHGSYNFSMHVLTLPPICVLKTETAREEPQVLVPPEDGRKAGSENGSKVSPDLTREKLREWLAPPDPLTTHKDAHPGTGKRFIQGKEFRWWKNKDEGASLLIWGERMFLAPVSSPRLLITSSFSQPGRERLSFGMQFPESSVH